MIVFMIVLLASSFQLNECRGPPRLAVGSYKERHLLNLGDSLRLPCTVDAGGDSSLMVTWFKDDDEINVGWDRYRVRNDALYVKDAETEDTGVFVCRATNGFGSVDVRYLVYVMPPVDGNSSATPPPDFDEDFLHRVSGRAGPPKFVGVTADGAADEYVELRPGGATRLVCHADGRPKPEVRWFKDDQPLQPPDNSMVLTLDDVTRQHGGRYVCRASNRLGSVSRNYVVQVTDDTTGGEPVFSPAELENVTVVAGSPAALKCRVFSDIQTRVQWLRVTEAGGGLQLNARPLNVTLTLDDQRYYTATLNIHAATSADSGVYMCSATNRRGSAYRRASVDVRPPERSRGADTAVDADPPGGSLDASIVVPLCTVCAVVVVAAVVTIACRRRCCGGTGPKSSPPPSRQPPPATYNTYLAAAQTDQELKREYARCFAAPDPTRDQCAGRPLVGPVDMNGVPVGHQLHGSMFGGSMNGMMQTASPRQPLMQQQQQPPPPPSVVQYHYYEQC